MSTSATAWQPTDPAAARALRDERLQLHYAAQFATALGISYLAKADDDSHTNLGWHAQRRALMSRPVAGAGGTVSGGVLAAELALVLTVEHAATTVIALSGVTLRTAAGHFAHALSAAGLDRSRFTLDRHYELPEHPVAAREPFSATNRDAFEQLARWYGNASLELERIAREVPNASEVRTWPHHFDMATLISHAGGRSTGVGLSPGDESYDEPYFYVNMYPAPAAAPATSLDGDGSWHTAGWTGAVLPGSRITGDGAAQQAQVRAFLDSALRALR